jgi:hypothetical protein
MVFSKSRNFEHYFFNLSVKIVDLSDILYLTEI